MRHANRHLDCPKCRKPAAGDGDNCIFCGNSLQCQPILAWRSVYHAYSYADAILATSALQSHGLAARLSVQGAERALMGASHGIVMVADGQHLRAQELLRQLRGVRTDTEYLEWQAIKGRQRLRKRVLASALAALAVAMAAAAVTLLATVSVKDAEVLSTR